MHKRFHFNRVLMRYLLSFLIVFLGQHRTID